MNINIHELSINPSYNFIYLLIFMSLSVNINILVYGRSISVRRFYVVLVYLVGVVYFFVFSVSSTALNVSPTLVTLRL